MITILIYIITSIVVLYFSYLFITNCGKRMLGVVIMGIILGLINHIFDIAKDIRARLEMASYIYKMRPDVCRTVNFDNAVAICGTNSTYYVYYQACGFFTGHVYVECNNMTFNNYDGNDCVTLIKLKCWYVDDIFGFVCVPTI